MSKTKIDPAPAKYSVGQMVRWTSSGTAKVGEIVAIVPAGKKPRDVGYPKAGGGGNARDHHSYVIKGQKVVRGVPGGPRAVYWPVVSLITA